MAMVIRIFWSPSGIFCVDVGDDLISSTSQIMTPNTPESLFGRITLSNFGTLQNFDTDQTRPLNCEHYEVQI